MTYQYRHLVDMAGFGLLVLEAEELRIIDLNPAACRLLDKRPEELVGMPIGALGEHAREMMSALQASELNPGAPTKSFCIELGERTIAVNAVRLASEGFYILSLAEITSEVQKKGEWSCMLETLLIHVQEPMFILDQDMRILRLFWAQGRKFGIDTVMTEGKKFSEVFKLEDADQGDRIAFAPVGEHSFEFSIDSEKGRALYRARLLPIESTEIGGVMYLGICEEIAPERPEQSIANRLEKETDFRKDFIKTAAHELRTPLQPLLGYLNILLEDAEGFGLSEDVKKMLQKCLENVERERHIVDRMLELSLVYEGKFKLNLEPLPLRTLISSVIEKGGFDGKAEFTIDVPEDIAIVADRDCMYSVLHGLISNAIQFSNPPRKVWISHTCDEKKDLIQVRDNGIGISKEAIGHIFEPFHLLDGERLSRAYNRMGLSLSIARNYIHLHGGEIRVESEVGVGSTFTIHLPRKVTNGL